MYCSSKTQVINSRPQKRLNRTWRRRECTKCHAVFTTEESVDLSGSVIVRRPQTPLQPFNRDKLFASLYKSLGHRVDPVEDASALCDTIIAKLLLGGAKASISPLEIVMVCTDTLQRFDHAAATQYAAYHRS